jgi:AcrR family transcriptional regulator
MGRSQTHSDPAKLLPVIARAFAELGYRRATTAELAKRCGVRENILYRRWPDKKRMFLASIEHVYQASIGIWEQLLSTNASADPAKQLLEYETVHHGEYGLYRIVFAALSEAEDADIRQALRRMYRRFHQFIQERVFGSRRAPPSAENLAWAMIGLGTVSNIVRELGLMNEVQRRQLFSQIGQLLLKVKKS